MSRMLKVDEGLVLTMLETMRRSVIALACRGCLAEDDITLLVSGAMSVTAHGRNTALHIKLDQIEADGYRAAKEFAATSAGSCGNYES
ncbi:hypothetical protein AB4099_18855 [Bosea sp. 2KB_26]|uniref:hypothetical protein n=1 Tax=Bosea sp. 2KB_26 TaxID=3237475 RepID=UPI003F8F9880